MKIKVLVDGDLVLSHLFCKSECEEDIYLFWDLMESGQIEAYITPPSLSKILDEISKNQSIQVVKNYYYQITEVIQILPINKILYQKALNLKLFPIKLALEQVCAQTNKLIYLNCKSFVNFCPLCHKLFEFNTSLNTCLDRQSLELLYYLESSYSSPLSSSHVPPPQLSSNDTKVATTRHNKGNPNPPLKNLEKGRNKPKLGKKEVKIQLHPKEKTRLQQIAESFNLKHGDKGSITALLSRIAQDTLMIVATPPNRQIRSYLPSDPDETLDMSLSDIIESEEVVDDLGSGIDYLF